MVDSRRLNTGQALAAGILELPCPKSSSPDYAEYADVNEEGTSEERRAALEAGKGLDASMYYGVWRVWPDGDGFSGELMQYRNITDTFSKLPLEDALKKADEWFSVCWG